MDNNTAVKRPSKRKNGTSGILYGIISGAVMFTLCILLIPYILSKSDTPENYISLAAVITVSLTSFASAFAASKGAGTGKLFTGVISALAIIMLLVCVSLIFGKSEGNKNYLFSGILYVSSFIFAILGAKAAGKKKGHRKNKKRS